MEGIEERALAGADVEDRPVRRDLVEPRCEQTTGASEQHVAGEMEPGAGVGPVPGPVRGFEPGFVGPRIGRGGAAAGAADPAAESRPVAEPGTAPGAPFR